MVILNVVAPEQFWQELSERLHEWDIGIEPSPELKHSGEGVARVVVRGRQHSYDAIVLPAAQSTVVPMEAGAISRPDLVISDKINSRAGRMLRGAGVDYVDACGAASLMFGDVVVVLSGVGTPRERLGSRRWDRSTTNLFSAGRAQVLAVLLSWPALIDSPVRTIARVAGTSVGLVHDVLSALESLGHIDRSAENARITNRTSLALNWAAAYPGGLRRKLDLGTFYSDPGRWRTVAAETLVGGDWAVADLVSPARVTVYAAQIDGPLISGLRLRAAESNEANTTVLRRFWEPPSLDEQYRIPWLLTFAELTASSDARVVAAANDFFKRHVG